MSCKSCATGGCGTQRGASDGPGGESQKTATTGCGSGGCSSGGCNKLNSFDWLSDIAMPGLRYDVVEVKFKGGRKEYYRNVHQLDLTTGDYVVVEMQSG